MALTRTLEPEVMDSEQDATEYNEMDHTEVNRQFVADLLTYANGVWEEFGVIGRAAAGLDDEELDGLPEFRLGDVLDVGTGTALIPVALCKSHPHCRVMAIDMATSMLNLAVYNLEIAGLTQRITLAQIDAKKMIFADNMFDAIMSNSIIHHLPEPFSCLQEIVRVGRPGGLIFVRDLMRPADQATVQQLVQTYAGEESEYSRRLFSDSLHAALSLTEIQEMVASLGFPAESVQATSDRHWTWAAHRR